MRPAPVTPMDAARVLWQIDQDLDEVTAELIAVRRARAGLEREYRMTYARSFLSTEGSVEVRRQRAIIAADEARFQLDTCDQETEACKERLRTLRDRSEIGRALNSNLKEELRVLHSTGGAA